MYLHFQQNLAERVRALLRAKYQLDLPNIVMEQPPKIAFGEFALPLAFELAKRLRKPPRKAAEEIVSGLGGVPGFKVFELAGAGYINARVDRSEFIRQMLSRDRCPATPKDKILVEHTSINPNKAAHIGHLRNAILGDTFVRLLREASHPVDVQNYIDNTGAQVADVVVGFEQLERKTYSEVEALTRAPRFDYYCWDLYARVSQWYEEDSVHKQIRLDTLHKLEADGNETARLADLISTAILKRHLETMQRLGIVYDFLPRESEILHLHFWELAFEQLKQKGVLRLETDGKNKGCWVMKRSSASGGENTEEDDKVIVRSNGTVTYVGKDIAYHLWKFGLLGRDFGYRRFYRYPDGQECWMSSESGEKDHPHFGGVSEIYNVIDSRQSDPQNNVIEALRALGYADQAAHYTHFSYEMVALTPRCAIELGYDVSEEDRKRAYIEVSGRKGFGVKADDLLDALIASAQKEVDARHPERGEHERKQIATQISVGALRYFMLKFTKGALIAFDFKDALSFEGETGPYVQYAIVRVSSIFRKAGTSAEESLQRFNPAWGAMLEAEDDIWELWLTAGKFSLMVDQCISTTEPAYLAKYAFQLGQLFNNFYHRHHILTEEDVARKSLLLATAAVVRRELVRTLSILGIEAPDVM
ncbi:MAG: arginine--tRNA ligase [Acidobacteria bacterium]|nr:MAG: arginine--tRNA ligase [Acidobacteriota bacterium]